MFDLFHVWIDADSCPREVRRVLLRAVERFSSSRLAELLCGARQFYLPFHFVAAGPLPMLACPQKQLYCHRVAAGEDASDQFIMARCLPGDIVITRDIVFAENICLQDARICVLNDRGVVYNNENITARRRRRDLALKLRRDDSLPKMAAANYSTKNLHNFAACFDHCVTRQIQCQKKYWQSRGAAASGCPKEEKLYGQAHC